MDDINKRINRRIGQLVKAADRDIAREYASFMREIRELLGFYYEKYEVGGKLTYEDMAKYDRLQKLYKQVHGMSKKTYKDAEKVLERVLKDVYEEGYYLTAYGMEQEVLKNLKYSGVRNEVIIAAINNPIAGLTLSELLEKNRTLIEYTIRTTVNQGLVKGETYGTMASALKEVLNKDYAKTMRIARTEAHRVNEQGKYDSAKYAEASGIVIVETWRSVHDERVRSSHARLDGVEKGVDEYFEIDGHQALYPGGFGVAKEDINCRCFVTREVVDIKQSNLQDIRKESFDQFMKGVKK